MTTHVDIVHYHPDYAESVAEMWNRSQDEWGGGPAVRTAEQIRRDEESSDAMAVFLAVCDGQVVGYCSLGEYREDTGALYIQLLNVRPDYHGRKIGKLLVLRAVEETIRLGWPRVDLYTWEANMKAVPLYKKCGFFWEDREDATHFMNFIPQVAACEALAPYLNDIDWYADLTRTIEVKPDGRKENGFDIYTYAWSKNGQSLRVDIERRGRGICLIETEDYLLSAAAEQAEPVFGSEYVIEYRIVNKSGAPLKLELQGESDRNVAFDWQSERQVEGEERIAARFFVGAIEEEQSEWRTCPAVQTRVRINGLEALLKVGIVPKFPAGLKMQVPDVRHALGGDYVLYLDMQNHFPETATFSFELPEQAWLALGRKSFEARLEAKERISLAVPYRLLDYGFYQARLQVRAVPDNGPEVTFTRFVGGAFAGPGAMFTGETENNRVAVNSGYGIEYDKDHNEAFLQAWNRKDEQIMLLPPSIGKPYSAEFTRKKPIRVEPKEERGAVGFRHTYRSDAFPQLLLHLHTLLYADGTAKLWQELENDSDAPVVSEMWISQRIRHDLYGIVLPYDGQIVETTDSHGIDFEYWDGSKISEPWLFARGARSAYGICWSDNHRMNMGDWYLELETRFGRLEAGETKTSDTIFLSMGGFDDWSSLRDFALKRIGQETTPPPIGHVELTANGGNPFVPPDAEEVPVTLRDAKQTVWEGELSAGYTDAASSSERMHLSSDDEAAEARFMLPPPASRCPVVRVDARLGAQEEAYHAALFPVSAGEVSGTASTEAGYSVLEADNGIIRISASADYNPGLRSLSVGGREWLASGFPEYGAKSWWNPWTGGLSGQFDEMGPLSVRKEEHSAAFVRLSDGKGNVWAGIRVRQSIRNHDTFKGTTMDSYYLMLPGVPVLAYMTDIRQNTGTYLDKSMLSELFLRPDGTDGYGWLRTSAPNGKALRYPLGKGELSVRETKDYVFGLDGRTGVMHIVTDEEANRPSVYTNKDICCLSLSRRVRLPHGSVSRSAPVFLVFPDDPLPADSLEALRRLAFPLILETSDTEGE
ncbi:GNAT family N-acetyltransferase [Paenibacillus ehimensis]|uniref:GNAT family N-acetyltransferase n=1 Tax=Paenibacillus ehimensis TaxID=79264 RepID=UPI002DBDEB93|nr:GNAT family N-acetyltransferase [Paenibacillus ehimensis]MEC0207424.1 GNAT family N-acetyltransferase [Paenibacillus ehimensis]